MAIDNKGMRDVFNGERNRPRVATEKRAVDQLVVATGHKDGLVGIAKCDQRRPHPPRLWHIGYHHLRPFSLPPKYAHKRRRPVPIGSFVVDQVRAHSQLVGVDAVADAHAPRLGCGTCNTPGLLVHAGDRQGIATLPFQPNFSLQPMRRELLYAAGVLPDLVRARCPRRHSEIDEGGSRSHVQT